MTQYTLVNPTTGKRKSFSAGNLTGNLQMNCILFRGDEHLGIITHRDLVLFTRWCAGETLAQAKEPPNHRVTHVLSLVDRWLEDEKSVSSKELEAASRAAWACAGVDGAWAAAWTAAIAAEGDLAGANIAAWSSDASMYASWVTSYEAQAQWLVEHLQSGK